MTHKIVACHQPNFLPWLGYFSKIAKADIFILLDDVQFTQGANKHNWTSRVRINASNGPLWLSMPVLRKGVGPQLISEVTTDNKNKRWLKKMLGTIDAAYSKAPYYEEVMPNILGLLSQHSGSVCKTNIALIKYIISILNLDTEIIVSSKIGINTVATDRLIQLTQAMDGSIYLSGDGADDYQISQAFRDADIILQKLNFNHPVYIQKSGKDFVPGLSIIDALCFVGMKKVRDYLINYNGKL